MARINGWSLPVLALLALLASAGCREPPLVIAEPERIDFGEVPVGTSKVERVAFTNRSDAPQAFELMLAGDDYGVFRVRPKTLNLQPGQTAKVEVALVNTRTGALQARLVTIGEEEDPLVEMVAEGVPAGTGAAGPDASAR